MSPRKPRATRADEQALFEEAVRDAKPLAKRARMTHASKIVIPHIPRAAIPKAPVFPETPAPAIGGHVEARLRRGRAGPEARLDLHGLTHDAAYRVLLRFLIGAQAEDKRLVLVITGKGGVLRTYLPLWLGQKDVRPLVGGVSQAHASHGGAGAFYVSLRRIR
jgi:DNA-nicking Smr family endonuclease